MVVDLTRHSRATPQGLWSVLTDYAGYGAWIPLTQMRTDPGPPHLGWQFVGLSGLGRVRFADSMLITRWEPPEDGAGAFRVVKTGRVLAGWAEVEVARGRDGEGSTVRWQEEIVPRPQPVGRLVAPLTGRVTAAMFGSALDAMVARADREAGGKQA